MTQPTVLKALNDGGLVQARQLSILAGVC